MIEDTRPVRRIGKRANQVKFGKQPNGTLYPVAMSPTYLREIQVQAAVDLLLKLTKKAEPSPTLTSGDVFDCLKPSFLRVGSMVHGFYFDRHLIDFSFSKSFQNFSSVFCQYSPHLAMKYPSNFFIRRFHPGKYS
jgi:hypothetical protein